MDSDLIIKPAPWNLEGEGYILLFRLTKKDIEKDKFLSDKFKSNFIGGFGSIMIVDYKSSDVGPYSELLFIPGKFKYQNKKKHTISKIFVSTNASIVNGIKNWAIPKEKGIFEFNNTSKNTSKISCSTQGKTFFSADIKGWGPQFPVNTALLPFPLVQEKDGKAYFTKFQGRGTGKLAKVLSMESDSKYFPQIDKRRIFIAIKLENFRITFPIPEIISLTD
jgi:hypothetical protein